MTQAFDVLAGSVHRFTRRRQQQGHHQARRLAGDRWRGWDGVNRSERQGRRVVIVQRAPGVGIVRARVKGEMPMDEHVRVPVVFGFVDVFRRSHGKRPDDHGEHEPDELTPYHPCAMVCDGAAPDN